MGARTAVCTGAAAIPPSSSLSKSTMPAGRHACASLARLAARLLSGGDAGAAADDEAWFWAAGAPDAPAPAAVGDGCDARVGEVAGDSPDGGAGAGGTGLALLSVSAAAAAARSERRPPPPPPAPRPLRAPPPPDPPPRPEELVEAGRPGYSSRNGPVRPWPCALPLSRLPLLTSRWCTSHSACRL